ncbi:MAG TPA: HAMP domain-containing sensor histidine kinase [Acidimicrobiales bacterium]|nr:HAMP domain-containing sensor histidine kinase [Acidimicrobiales bacterium]
MPDPTEDERLVRFARIVAHGMRNPLAIATGMLDLLDRQVGDAIDVELRDLLRRSSDALRRAGDQLLQLQRYTAAARDELVLDEVDVADAVDEAAEGVDLGEATLHVEDLPLLLADRRAVVRALHELLDNALRHAADGGPPRIVVSGADEGEAWAIAVTDDGPGIPADQRAAALSEGERLGRTGDGFGLGLPTARILLRRHGGEVRLEDAPGGGLRVVLVWPKAPLLVEEGAQG